MTKPDWCPQDVWEAAGLALLGWTIDDGTHAQFDACRASVARAILAERERCAAVCRTEAASARAEGLLLHTQAALWCAKSIEKGQP